MKCPHCLVEIHSDESFTAICKDVRGSWGIFYEVCPSCKKVIVKLAVGESYLTNGRTIIGLDKGKKYLVYPHNANRPPCPVEVPNEYSKDYNEAGLILTDSPNASAALSRRCLQNILREVIKVKKSNLINEIQEAIDKNILPSTMNDALDTVRIVGNFAAHPMKSNASGEIIEVEENEAEWNLDVLESLFDYCFVGPRKLKEMKDKLNAKLKKVGKPEMK